MSKKMGILLILAAIIIFAVFARAGCQTTEIESDEQLLLQGEGILVGQIDSQSVEIDINGQARVFGFDQGVNIAGITDGSAIIFSYIEEETRFVLVSIATVEAVDEVLLEEGLYSGQIDSHSVEILVDGQPRAFAIGEGLLVDDLAVGSWVAFTYLEGEQRPLLLSIEVIDGPESGDSDELVGEGILVGLIDGQSVEIEINRAFMLFDEVNIDEIEEGSLVAFTFTESGQRAVLDSIKAVDKPIEGDIMHGVLICQSDDQSVEIQYFQAFALGEGISVAGIADGSEVRFTYQQGLHRPVLTSLSAK